MSLANAARIAQALGISLERLATGQEPSPNTEQPRHLFLRGTMGVGKSEILQEIARAHPDCVAGLYAQRVLRNGRRVGFALQAVLPGVAWDATVEWERVEKNRVFLYESGRVWRCRAEVFERWGMACLQAAYESKARLLLMDELGGMELLCDPFMEWLYRCLEALPCLGVFKSNANAEAMAAKLPDAHRCRAQRAACLQRLTRGLNAAMIDITEDNAKEVHKQAWNFARYHLGESKAIR